MAQVRDAQGLVITPDLSRAAKPWDGADLPRLARTIAGALAGAAAGLLRRRAARFSALTLRAGALPARRRF
ncbi:MAG: hypothetical protein AAFV49_13625 [Pseudomonadota bacterium]